MGDVRIVGGDQNHPPIIAADVRALQRANAIVFVQVNASGDIINSGGGSSGGGDGAVLDGVNSAIKGTVTALAQSSAQNMMQVGPSGEQIVQKSDRANYGRKNVTNIPTKILSSNKNRVGCFVQNLEGQLMAIGFDLAMTFTNLGGMLTPTISNSGDGGAIELVDYTGEVWGVVPAGDSDVAYSEFLRPV